jgi:hypothetical protein
MADRTPDEIKAEIEALRRLVPHGPFRYRTEQKLTVAIEELTHGVDQTAPEWEELSDEQRDMVQNAISWREQGGDAPSSGWGDLVVKH